MGVSPLRSKHPGGTDVGMAGKADFSGWCEDAYLGGMVRVIGRQHEGRLAEVELAGQGLHRWSVQPAGVGDHGQRVAAETAIGEHI